ncbi:MAG: ABC transporter ATP-binding protein [Candidatus Rokubacteria bacterium]|nr:ABC transporter ATP-binding protein [Candidatus Rokubacteria bacterium]
MGGVLCLAIATLASLGIPWTVKRAVEALETDAANAALGVFVGSILGLAAINAAARLGSRLAMIGAAQRVEADIRDDLYASLTRFPPALFTRYPTGDLMARATSDVSGVKTVVGFGGVSMIQTTFAFVGAIAAMVVVDPWLTLWAMLPFPAMILLARRFTSLVHERTEAMQGQLGVLSGRVQEHLAGMSVVRAYAMEGQARETFGQASAAYLRHALALSRIQAQFTPLMSLIAGVGTLVVLWAGGLAVVEGRITLGSLVAFNGYLAYLAWPTLALGWTLSMVRRGLTSMGRIQEVVEAVPDVERTEASRRVPRGGPAPRSRALAFRGLAFTYGDRAPALVDVTFEVGEGEVVAVVGPTGSGKSTLGLLLVRLWDPPIGTVFVGGQDVTAMDLATLRGDVAYVPQESFLFSRSIQDNVTLARPDVDQVEAKQAIVLAGVAEEIEGLPRGLDTVVGERGLTLSGGQRQRVALARALAGEAPILVLDDVFANVDAAKEEEILGNLAGALHGRTVLLTTHRLRAARAADRIVVLDAGRVVETGTHDALIERGGLYARLWRIQQLEEEIAHAP